MNFTVVLIAKNEEKTLPRLLGSLSEFKKQGGSVIIVDTGSTDNTIQVARDWGCIVNAVGDRFLYSIDETQADSINKKFIVKGDSPVVKEGDKLFDYAAARNYAASLATTNVIAMPDCDEEYTVFNLPKIVEAIDNGAEQLEYNFVFSHDEYGNDAKKFLHCKFYDKTKLKWVGIIHEVLQGNARRQFLDESVIKLEHFQQPDERRNRYLTGLALDCYLNPDNDRNSHYFGRELYWTGRYKSAIKELERHVKMNRWQAEKAQSMIYIGDCYGKLNQPEEQVKAYSLAISIDSTRREAYLRLADFYRFNNNPTAAAVYASGSLEIPWSAFYANDLDHYRQTPHEILYWAKGWQGDVETAKKHLLKALEYQPLNPRYLHDYRYYFNLPKVTILIPTLGRPEGLARCIESIAKLNYPQDLIQTLTIKGDETVPEKVKKGFSQATGEWIIYASNDIEFEPDSLILAYIHAQKENKKLVAFNTGEVLPDEGNICEHFMIHRDLVPEIGGEIFCTRMKHCGVDNLLWAKCKKLNQATRATEAKINHYHFSKGSEYDDVYKKGWQYVEEDRKILQEELAKL